MNKDNEGWEIVTLLLATLIFFSPNFLLLFDYFLERIWLIMIANFISVFMLLSAFNKYKLLYTSTK